MSDYSSPDEDSETDGTDDSLPEEVEPLGDIDIEAPIPDVLEQRAEVGSDDDDYPHSA